MSWCVVVGCHNNSKRNSDKSYFRLPKDENCRKEWIKLINRTSLPSRVYVCSDHFEESCFDSSWALQNSIFYKDRPAKRRLIPGSKPSIFPHKERPKERETSNRRAHKREKEEV